MGMPATRQRRWTRAEVLELIERNPLQTPIYEVVDGELLVSPSPRPIHQIAVTWLLFALMTYCEQTGIGEGLTSPSDTELEPDTLVHPDVYVVPRNEGMLMRTVNTGRRLLLAAEVLSPSSQRADRGRKRLLYQRTVPLYWIVDLDARAVESWLPDSSEPTILRDRLEWHPSGAASPFTLDLSAYFARVFGER
jgi:Uma2 family endonuclease